MAKHAKLSASQTKQWWFCPGSTALAEIVEQVDRGSGMAAMEGTAAHALVERCLQTGLHPKTFEDRIIKILNPGEANEGTSILKPNAKFPSKPDDVAFIVDQDMWEAVECMTEYVHRRCFELGLLDNADNFSDVAELVKKGIVALEQKVNPLPHRKDTGGTGDVRIDCWPVILEIVDYKHGAGVFVPVTQNHQLRSYGLGALQDAGADDYENVVYTICQPRHRDAPSDGIMSEEITADELLDWGKELDKRATRVDDARKFLKGKQGTLETLNQLYDEGFISVGEDGSHCTFCAFKKQGCPAAQAKLEEILMTDFDEDPDDIPLPPEADFAKLLPWIPYIDSWIKGITTEAELAAFAGRPIDGFKIVRGRSNRQWNDNLDHGLIANALMSVGMHETELEALYDHHHDDLEVLGTELERIAKDDYNLDYQTLMLVVMENEFGLTKEQLTVAPPEQPPLISGPQAEKLVDKKDRKDFNEKMLFKPEGKLVLVADTDSRPAVELNVEDDFDDEI